MSNKPKIVIAGNYREFDYWCRFENDPPLNPHDRSAAIYIGRYDEVRGLRFSRDQVVRYGTYLERRDWPEINMEVEVRIEEVGE